MTSFQFKEMKWSKLLCASPSSTVICTSIDRRSLYQPSKTRQQVSPIPQAIGKLDRSASASSRWLLSKDATSETEEGDKQVALMTSASQNSTYQVVVLRVSIYCKGCERKVKKHLSKMKGVASYHVDLEMKKVTVISDLTPVEVLNSVSKVKNAQFWESPPCSSSSSSSL